MWLKLMYLKREFGTSYITKLVGYQVVVDKYLRNLPTAVVICLLNTKAHLFASSSVILNALGILAAL